MTTEETKPTRVRKSRRVDPDLSARKACSKALNRSSSRPMLKANLEFLYDRFIFHPSPEIAPHLQRQEKPA
jgi:hypothetical protein